MINNIGVHPVRNSNICSDISPSFSKEVATTAIPQDGFQAQEADFSNYSNDVKDLAQRLSVEKKCELSEVKVLAGTDGDDVISIAKGENPGELVVDINGNKTTLTGKDTERTIIDGGKGNDTITIDQNLYQGMYITGGEGNDTITAGKGACTIVDNYGSNFICGSAVGDVIIANGYDLSSQGAPVSFTNAPQNTEGIAINGNIIFGMGGNDYIEGSKANDYIDAGNGNNVAYGMGGDDYLTATSGGNYLSGGEGNDLIRANEGRNILVGGHGNDRLFGGSGQDVIIGGAGKDQIQDGRKGQYDRPNKIYTNSESSIVPSDNDSIIAISPSHIPANLTVQGDAIGTDPVNAQAGSAEFHEQNGRLAFQERIIDDLETLANLPSGQTMLRELGDLGKQVDFNPTFKGNNCRHFSGASLDDRLQPGPGSNSEVNYNRSKISSGSLAIWGDRPPVVGMFHEMCHSYNSARGNLDGRFLDPTGRPASCAEDWMYSSPGCEYQAVGIKNPAVEANPKGLTENDLRSDLNLVNRDSY